MCAKLTTNIRIEADPGTEIFLVDEFLERIDSKVQTLERDVEPGVYKVRFLSGGEIRDKLIDATDPSKPVVLKEAPIHFPSAAPIVDTSTTHEYHMGPASRYSREAPVAIGNSSRLFLFVRAVNSSTPFPDPNVISIHQLDGTRIAGFEKGQRNDHDRWASLHLELDPGTYRLRVDGMGAGIYEMFVTLSPLWQTQIFQLIEEFPSAKGPVFSPSLRNSAVLMSRIGQGFDPSRADFRLAEMARMGLMTGRDVIGDDLITSLLHGEEANPLLGLYAAHILVKHTEANKRPRKLLKEIISYLERVIPGHPDLLSLQLHLAPAKTYGSTEFKVPPMIRSSWDMVVQASHQVSKIVPPGSVADLCASNILDNEPWLLFEVEDTPLAPSTGPVNTPKAKRDLAKILSLDPERLNTILSANAKGEFALNNLQESILRSAAADNSFWQRLGKFSTLSSESGKRAALMFESMPSPSGSTASAIVDLSHKIKLDDGTI